MSERLTGIDAFVATVEAGNFALAAQRLGLTRSAVAKSVARMEARLGARLFQRTTRSQRLTEDGQVYYERCRRALAELDAADAMVEAGHKAPQGRLRVTMPVLIGRALVAPLLFELLGQHPDLALDIVFSDSVIDLVDECIDLAVRSGVLEDSATLSARLLGRQWMGVYASPDYLAHHGWPRSFDELAAKPDRYRYVGYSRPTVPHPWQFYDAKGRIIDFDASAHFRFSCNSLEANVGAAVAGAGLTRVPDWLAVEAVRAGTLVRVFDEPRRYGYPLHAVWPQARALPMKTRVAIDLLAARMPTILAPIVMGATMIREREPSEDGFEAHSALARQDIAP